jgi:uncharacterized membrane protein
MTLETSPRTLQAPKFWLLIIIAFVLGGMLASSVWIFKPYSYWLDELFSVTAANESLSSLHTILLSDVHPPLYQVLLKLWILIFGDSELSTRALSLGFATAAVVYLYSKTSKYGNIFCGLALLFFSTNWLYAFYANETRSYSMMLFFATILATNIPVKDEKPSMVFYVSSVLLSLTHYFGLLMTGVTCGVYILKHLKQPRLFLPVLTTGILCLAWPVYHMLAGEVLNKTDGNFWIKVNGLLDSLRIAAMGYVPKTGKIGGIILVAGLFFAIAITRPSTKLRNISSLVFLPHVHTTAIVSLVFLGLIAVIDTWTPMSTTRNYIVLLPFLSLTVAGTIALLVNNYPKTRKIFFSLVVVYCSLALLVSFYSTYRKSMAQQDWLGASLFILNNHDGRNIYHITNSEKNMWRDLIANFYLKKFSNKELHAQPYVVGKTKIETPAMIIFGNVKRRKADAIESEMQALRAIQSYERETPVDIRRGDVGVFVAD